MSPPRRRLLLDHLRPWTSRCEDLEQRPRSQVTTIVIHRIEVSQVDASYGDSPTEVIRFFQEHPVGCAATGSKMPYPVLIDSDGRITQTLALGRISPHAVQYNASSIGIACIGDFRHNEPGMGQYGALVEVCARLLAELSPPRQAAQALFGHDELIGASHHPDKICPGGHIAMEQLRDAVDTRLRSEVPPSGLLW